MVALVIRSDAWLFLAWPAKRSSPLCASTVGGIRWKAMISIIALGAFTAKLRSLAGSKMSSYSCDVVKGAGGTQSPLSTSQRWMTSMRWRSLIFPIMCMTTRSPAHSAARKQCTYLDVVLTVHADVAFEPLLD